MFPIIDMHCDTLGFLPKSNFLCGSTEMNLSLTRLIRGNVRLQCFAVCVHPDNNGKCLGNGLLLVNEFKKLTHHTDIIMPIQSSNDMDVLFQGSHIGAMLTVEGGDIFERNEENFDLLYSKGMRMLAITWNNSNALCSGIDENSHGLTEFGKKITARCVSSGVIMDVSHISEAGFWDINELYDVPFVASHSNARTLCSHKRNLTDDQLYAIKAHNGCVGINFYPPFLNNDGKASIDDIIRHIEYIAGLIGIEHVAIGSDFDGVDNNLPNGMEHPGKLQKLVNRLIKLNYTDEMINSVCHKNAYRVFSQIL